MRPSGFHNLVESEDAQRANATQLEDPLSELTEGLTSLTNQADNLKINQNINASTDKKAGITP